MQYKQRWWLPACTAFLLCCQQSLKAQTDTAKQMVPLGGNSWVTVKAAGGNEQVTNKGWENWAHANAVFSTYIRLNKPGTLKVYALLSVPEGESRIQCRINGKAATTAASGGNEKEYLLGTWDIQQAGYVKADIQGISKTGKLFANAARLYIAGTAVDEQTAYVKSNEGNYFYWGRRGPSVHLNYDLADAGKEIEWFYNEITVPEGYDPVGSYFMADGFGEGYFGMQVNSPAERRILFSVWSPFTTNDPSKIPDDQKIRLLKKGKEVHAGEFGNEGSGGQSYLRYNWKPGATYRFLLHARPDTADYTTYTAYFYAPEQQQWMLVASFSRPHTNTWLTHLHSFLENFDPSTGYITRKAWYHNQWVRTKGGQWLPLSKMRFTGDATAQKGYRLDYGGGVEQDRFFLHNCGFFNNNTALKTSFTCHPAGKEPVIPFSSLE